MSKLFKKAFFQYLLLGSAVLFFVLLVQNYNLENENLLSASFAKNLNINQPVEKETITLMFVGDIMLDRGVEYMIKKFGDWKWPFLKITDDLKEADLLFGNLESQISDKGRNVGSMFSFRADPKVMEGLTYAGLDVVTLANNHCLDWTVNALTDSMKRLKEAGIDYTGGGFNEKEAYSAFIKEVKGTKIAFLGYVNLGSPFWKATKDSPGIAWFNEEKMKEGIKEAKESSDIVVVTFHFGDEYKLKPNENQKYLAHLAVDSGADLVIGHHPHVIQTDEIYKGKNIFYSLGNFVFDQNSPQETTEAQIVKVIIRGNKIREIIPLKVKINNFFQPELIQ